MIVEKRRGPRRRPDTILHVRDAMTGELVGQLGNVSLEGMMLVASEPILDDALYQFAFHLPDAHGHLQPIEVGAHEQWSLPSNMRGFVWAGFRFIDIGADDLGILRDWLMRRNDAAR